MRDTSSEYNLMWPTPALTWMERTGSPQQEVAPHIVDPDTAIARGMPHAVVGTSALFNTDVRPYDCYLGGTGTNPYSPNLADQNQQLQTIQNVEGLRYVQDPNAFCEYLQPETVLGIAINLTSNRTDLTAIAGPNYQTDGLGIHHDNGRREAMELLGVYSVVDENDSDQSFRATIPSDAPFDFQLLDRKYGMKLVDVRTWHSLQPRESRTDCGGCHQHEVGFGIPFEGTEAASKPPLDMTAQTTYFGYDKDCKPELRWSAKPTRPTPEWKADIWPGFDQHCGSCHAVAQSSDAKALEALGYLSEKHAYLQLYSRNWANSSMGALGSPAFWAAYGERTDGRDNTLPEYQPDYSVGLMGYRFSDVHATSPGLCAAENPQWAEWVHDFGLWIDNHMPRDVKDTEYPYKLDRFHPTLDFALTDPTQPPIRLRFGYWDNTGHVDLSFRINGVDVATVPGLSNGSFAIPLVGSWSPTDRIQAIATDATGNRQLQEKTVLQLLLDWLEDPG